MNKFSSKYCSSVFSIFFLSVVLFSSVSFALGLENNSGSAIELVKYLTVITVNTDGSHTEVTEVEEALLDRSGLDEFGSKSFKFNGERERFNVLQAVTIKKDGRHISAKPNNIHIQGEPQSLSSKPRLTVGKVQTVVFPNIEVGDHIRYSTRKVELNAQQPGRFDYVKKLDYYGKIDAYKIVLISPESMPIQFEQKGMIEGATTTNNGHIIRSWTYDQSVPLSNNSDDVFDLLNGPHIQSKRCFDHTLLG